MRVLQRRQPRPCCHTAKGDFAFNVEIADDDAERAQGLMFRDALAPDAGMLFDYHEEQEASFWMQNTLIPLDMIFIGAERRREEHPCQCQAARTRPAFHRGVPVRFVLEIPGGRSTEIGLAVGDKMEHPRVKAGG